MLISHYYVLLEMKFYNMLAIDNVAIYFDQFMKF